MGGTFGTLPEGIAVCRKALKLGACVSSPGVLQWDIAGDCASPVEIVRTWKTCVEFESIIGPGKGSQVRMYVQTRCRKCEQCLRARANLWAARAFTEQSACVRVWFCTFTVAPHHQALTRAEARKRLRDRAAFLDDETVFTETVKVLNVEVTKYIKRIRKKSPIRYLWVYEKHKSGLPHCHALIFDLAGDCRERELRAQWRLGHINEAKLVTGENEIFYVTKYLAKERVARVRASLKFGQ